MMISELRRLATLLLDAVLTASGVALFHCGLARLVIGRNPHAPRVLMYHACDEAEGDLTRGLSINTPPARLAVQLDFLGAHYRVIPLESLAGADVPERAVVITFDDGFRSVYRNARPLLEARGFPATCYLVTDRIDDPAPIWINELNAYLRRDEARARAVIERRLGIGRSCSLPVLLKAVLDRYDPEVIAGLLAELRATTGRRPEARGPEERPYLNRPEIEEMSRSGFTFGNHTGSHPVLSRLDEAACRDEIRRARAVLGGLPGAIDSLAYPFGRFGEATLKIARELGYTTLMEVEGDNDPLDRLHIGRLNVTSDSPAVLFARMEVVARVKPRIKRLLKRVRRRGRR
jgi:peptidoglycan/xylan/chitin deacetylase (PgdA/CDA1 family)